MKSAIYSLLFIAFTFLVPVNSIIASPNESVSQAPDIYSGRSDLKTIALGRSAYTDDGKSGVSVNIFQKPDGSYVVEVHIHSLNRGRIKSTTVKGYINARRDKENRICFIWNNKQYRTSPQIFRK